MRDGDGKDSVKSEKDNQLLKRNKKLGPDEFAYAMARIAVAQICERRGFQNFQQFALDAIADVGIRYISEVGKTSCFYCNMANRTQCNASDLLRALEDLGSVQGFSGASDVRHSLSGSGVVRDIFRYVVVSEETPFAHLIPAFPFVKKTSLGPSFVQFDENPIDGHIPHWLPKFPDTETCAILSSGKDKDSELMGVNKIQHIKKQHKREERPSLNLQQILIHSGYERVAGLQEDVAKAQGAAAGNPFLASPLQFGERGESLPVLPAKFFNQDVAYHQSCEVLENHVLMLDPSLKGNEMGCCDPFETEDRRKILLNGKPAFHFKIRNANKNLGMTANPRNAGIEDLSFWFDVDHHGSDEESTAGKILFENTEHPMNDTHL